MSLFCSIPLDHKTFMYVLTYIAFIENNLDVDKLDNMIQWDEIRTHIRWNNLLYNENEEIQKWVTLHSKNFRTYINTIKLIAEMVMVYSMDHQEIDTLQEFQKVVNKFKRFQCVNDTIHL